MWPRETKGNKTVPKVILPQLVKTYIKTGKHLDENFTSLFSQWPLRGCKQGDEFNLVFGEESQQSRIKSQQNWWENQGYRWKKSVTWKKDSAGILRFLKKN